MNQPTLDPKNRLAFEQSAPPELLTAEEAEKIGRQILAQEKVAPEILARFIFTLLNDAAVRQTLLLLQSQIKLKNLAAE